MRSKVSKRIISVLLAFVMMVGLIPAATMPARAQNVIGLINASGIRANEGVVLYGDTILNMDTDLTVPSIEGDYNLTVQGSGKLTVNGGGNGIDVRSLNCSSNLFIQTGWHAIEAAGAVYINNAESFIVGGIYAGGHIDIQCSNATIAGNGNAIFSSLGNITLSGGTFDIGANGIAVAAETGGIYMTGAFTVNSNNDRTINAAKGEMVVNGSLKSVSGAKFDPDVSFINRDRISIGAMNGFFFYGTTLEVEGLGGIVAGNYNLDTDISITADSVSIITERYEALNGGNIYVDSGELWLENEGSEENENATYDSATIYADKDVTLSSESGGIVGEIALTVFGTLTLNGNFVVGGDPDHDNPLIIANRMEANGKLVLRNDTGLAVDASESFSFNGTTLDIEGYGGIDADGGVNITADSTTIITSVSSPIASTGDVYIDSDYLFLQDLMEEELHPLAIWAGISAYGDVTVISDDATIIGRFGIRVAQWLQDTQGNVSLHGNFHVIGTIDQAILCDNDVTVEGSLIAQGSVVEQGSDNPFNYGECYTIYANRFSFNGTTLNIEGYGGIYAEGEVNITADSVVITTDVGDALNGGEVYVTANDLWAENKATKINSNWQSRGYTQHGISAESKLALTVKGGTVIGYEDGLYVYDEDNEHEHHYVYVDGSLTVVSKIGAGIYVPQGAANLFGVNIVSVGETYGAHADVLTFEGDSLRIDGDTGVYAISGVEMDGDDIRITAFNERRSGIWVENGSVDLEGKVTINTNGWYGINAASDVSFGEGYYAISGPKDNAQAVMVGGTLSVDGTLEIIQPDGGHVNGNEIYGAGDSPALELEMYSAIPEVSLLIDGPREGRLPTRKASDVYFLDPRCTVESIVWYEDGEEMVSQDALFRAGHRYTVKITLSADDPYRFVSGVMGKVNGKAVTTGMLGGDKKGMLLTANLGECAYAISAVELEITAPVEGKTPSTSVTDYGAAYGVYSRDVRWGVSTDGVNFTIMAAGEKFVGGKYYRVFMDVNLLDGLNGNGYKFPVTTAGGTVQPDVVATVNGSPAVVEKAYDQDPEEVITVYFDFGKCNDYIIEEIAIVDVVAPVAGQHPTYTANMFGTGYHVDTTKNSYEDIYWKNPPEKWYYVKNGVSWWDVTDGGYDYVYENDVFLPGHQYQCKVYVATDDGYEFVDDVYAEVWPTATVNGNSATVKQYGSGLMWEQQVSYTFTCEENVVDRIVVDGITAPKAGQAPDYTATLGNPDLYQLDTDYGLNGSGIYWYDCEGRQLEAGERFGDAGPYRIAIKFVPASAENGGYVSQFADDVEVIINGKSVTPYGDWDNVTVGSGTAWAFFTFRNASSAPELGVTVSGTVTSYQNASGDITLQLCEYSSGAVAYETTVKGNTVDYSFADVATGVYTLKVSKENHVTREYMVIVNSGSVVQDVKIHLLGDLNGDGRLRSNDLSIAYDHVSGEALIEDDYIFRCADIDGNGRIRSNDVTKMYAHTTGDEPLW